MADRRTDIIEAGLSVLRERGYIGFTQPRVASCAGLRQSHLTYYYPTRLDLLAAVARAAVDRQLEAVDSALAGSVSIRGAATAIADLVVRHQNTRVLLALAQASEEEPRLRGLFRELADGFVSRVAGRATPAGAAGEQAGCFLQALVVGLAVVDLATGRPDGLHRAEGILAHALHLIASSGKPIGASSPPIPYSDRGA